MTEFFIKTDAGVSGPFSGVELRELALAGILRPDSNLSASPHGPWQLAGGVGLFSEKKTPLPHPPDVQLTRYQVRGMAGAIQGPFKLRELIGFAARGMLPAEALLQAESDSEWVPVKRYRVLSACLDGDLVLLDDNGRVIRRAVQITSVPIERSNTRAPIELTRPADEEDSTAFAIISGAKSNHVVPPPLPHEVRQPSSDETAESPPGAIALWVDHIRERVASWDVREKIGQWIPLRRLVSLTFVTLVVAFGSATYFYWTSRPMPRENAIGEWLVLASGTQDSPSVSGIAFRADGKCVFFDPSGTSWTGDFQWAEQGDTTQHFQSSTTINATIDEPDPSHHVEPIRSTDGYMKLSGLAKELPRLDGHPVRELFVRRNADSLQLGYPTAVQWTAQGRTLLAAWTSATPSPVQPPNTKSSIPLDTPPVDLLAKFGVPDEARPIYRFEMGENSNELENAHILRYQSQKFALTQNGQLTELSTLMSPIAP